MKRQQIQVTDSGDNIIICKDIEGLIKFLNNQFGLMRFKLIEREVEE